MAKKLPIRPELFDVLIDYFAKVESGKVDLTGRVTQVSPLVTFCQNYFLQFFENAIGHEITSIGPGPKREAIGIRHALRKSGETTETLQLITWFEGFCDTYQDLLALGYVGGHGVALKGFIQDDLRTLLVRTIAWAQKLGFVGIEKKANAAVKALGRAVR